MENYEPNPNANVPLLRKAVEWVEAEAAKGKDSKGIPLGEWIQGAWATDKTDLVTYYGTALEQEHTCGTAFCVAGYVGQLQEPRYAEKDTVDGVHVSEFAEKVLGLTPSESTALFSGGNSAEDVRRIAERIAGEAL